MISGSFQEAVVTRATVRSSAAARGSTYPTSNGAVRWWRILWSSIALLAMRRCHALHSVRAARTWTLSRTRCRTGVLSVDATPRTPRGPRSTLDAPSRPAWHCHGRKHRSFCGVAFSSPRTAQTMLQSHSTHWTTRFATRDASKMAWHVGDAVHLRRDKDPVPLEGRIQEIHRGWYTIELVNANALSDTTTITCRAKDLVPCLPSTNASRGPFENAPVESTESHTLTPTIAANDSVTLAEVFPHVTTNRDAPELPIVAPPPPTIVNWDEVLTQLQTPSSALDDPSLSVTTSASTTASHEQLQQMAYFATFTKWVVFTDLHCSSSTLETCQQVLQLVHAQAVERGAGILFLGDFWHVRGSLRVDLLNAILLDSLAHWTQPCIMIPGNHDQVTAALTDNHSLTPLGHAYRVTVPPTASPDPSPSTLPGVLLVSRPTVWMRALWIPHVRSPAVLESILQSPLARNATVTQCILCHADVTGGSMNDNIVSNGGVPPRVFPHCPIYTGHFHTPHVVTRTTYDDVTGDKQVRRIEYLGSPYQVSLAEAHQSKALAVLEYAPTAKDNSWTCIDRIPLCVGRRHFRPATLAHFVALGVDSGESRNATHVDANVVRAGDRVVFSLDKEQLAELRRPPAVHDNLTQPVTNPLDEHVALLRHAGVLVEIRETSVDWKATSKPTTALTDASHGMTLTEDVSPPTVWRTFMDWQWERKSLSDAAKAALLPAGLQLLEEMEWGGDGSCNNADGSDNQPVSSSERAVSTPFTDPARAARSTGFQLDSLTLQGFGPFRDAITYPLSDRGLVLLRGSNQDGGTDSNGTGKTSLAMSILWALTGSIDPRPFQDAKVSDVVNDASKAAVVTLRGTLHGIPFAISRTKTSTKGGLTFLYDGVDHTTQSPKETQDLIYERLGISPDVLSRTMFHGQHSLNELLEATDSKLKDELSLVVNLSVWQNAATLTRKKAREATKRVSEYDGMLTIRSSDIAGLQQRLDEAQTTASRMKETYQHTELRIKEEIDLLATVLGEPQSSQNTLEDLGNQTSLGDAVVSKLVANRLALTTSQAFTLAALEAELESAQANLASCDTDVVSAERAREHSVIGFNVAQDRLASFRRLWKLGVDADVDDFVLTLPENCPTCHQSISGAGDDHNHESFSTSVQADFDALRAELMRTESDLNSSKEAVSLVLAIRQKAIDGIAEVQDRLDEANQIRQRQVEEIDLALQEARSTQQSLTAQVALTAKRLEAESKRHALLGDLATEKEKYESATRTAERIRVELQECQNRVLSIEADKNVQTQNAQMMGDLTDAFGPRGVQTFVLQGAVATLEALTRGMLDELSEGTQQLQLSLDSADRIARRAFVRSDSLRDGGAYKERPLGSLSGGQWRRCSLALTLAFAELVASRAHFNPSLIVLDEPLTHLDQTGRASVGRVLRSLIRRTSEHEYSGDDSSALQVSTILLILQDLAAVEMEECFDCIDDVVKSNGLSSVEVERVD